MLSPVNKLAIREHTTESRLTDGNSFAERCEMLR